jgi:hypothetical protein
VESIAAATSYLPKLNYNEAPVPLESAGGGMFGVSIIVGPTKIFDCVKFNASSVSNAPYQSKSISIFTSVKAGRKVKSAPLRGGV